INLVPFLGDTISVVISLFIIFTMYQYGASGKLVIRMVINVLIDALVGAIPFLGWIFDFYYKANEKNLRLLKEHYIEGKHTGSGLGILAFIFIICLALIALIIYILW